MYIKHIQRSSLKIRYDFDVHFQHQLKFLVATAFVPVEFVTMAFEVVCGNNVISAEGKPIVDYFEDTWIGHLE
ncbi:hypothetical protein ILUMI_10114 [Ignelater luminosus]|uniref:Uncharacterized protein n=1 Tax=Ignelater luminosus TaxID=2038154 RepID=A0A8K0D2W7_IGNLU|nr:hypothetical protein ILUMI_10114 [Ignelater luminosus]